MSGGTDALVVVTGMSGAGKTTALNALEDIGFLAIDNVPPALWSAVVEAVPTGAARGVALGIDIRARGLLDGAPRALAALRERRPAELLYLDADDDTLVRRFNFTRRTHPLADRSLGRGLVEERAALAPLRAEADLVIDTGALSARDLARRLWRRFARGDAFGLRLLSFGFKRGVPSDADVVLDVRGLPNPYYEPELRPLPGTDPTVQAYVFDATGLELYDDLRGLGRRFAELASGAGRSSYTVAVGCTGGQHRSVAVTERLAHDLAEHFHVEAEHRDLPAALAEHADEHAEPRSSEAEGSR